MEQGVITRHLVIALHGTVGYWSGDHALFMGEVRDEIRRQHTKEAETALGESQAAMSTEDARRMGKITRTGAWISVLTSTVNEMKLGVQEWRDSLLLRYGIGTPDLPENCDGCGA